MLYKLIVLQLCLQSAAAAFSGAAASTSKLTQSRLAAQQRTPSAEMAIGLNLEGKTAFVAGVGDSSGYGWAICKALAEAGCKITVGTWPPVLGIFEKSLKSGKFDEDMVLSDGSKMSIEKVYPLDAVFDEVRACVRACACVCVHARACVCVCAFLLCVRVRVCMCSERGVCNGDPQRAMTWRTTHTAHHLA